MKSNQVRKTATSGSRSEGTWRYAAIAAAVAVSAFLGGRAHAVDVAYKAIEKAAESAVAKLEPSKLGEVKSVAVLPLWDDRDGCAEDTAKAALTQLGVKVLARSANEWGLLLGEIEWNVKREDVMDPATIQRFGKIQGCDGVLYGTVREVSTEDTPIGTRGIARLSLHIADVETGQVKWSSGPVEAEFLDSRGFVERVLMHPAFWITVGALVAVALLLLVMRRAARPR